MNCPHCGNELEVDKAPIRNMDVYGNPVLAIARCCGKGVLLFPVRTYDVQAYYGDATEDNWGNPLKAYVEVDYTPKQ